MKPKKQPFLASPLKARSRGSSLSAGRNHKGRITAWHRGGGHARSYRDVDLHRRSTQGIVIGLEHDPNRSAFLARVFNPDSGSHEYILAPTQMTRGDIVRSDSGHNKNGHSQRLRYVTTGSFVYNLSLRPGGQGQMLRAPGSFGRLIKKTSTLAQVRLKSGRLRWFDINTIASLGIVSNPDARFVKRRKAGQSRWAGRRPVVRGVAMNPIDHPHGGGEGKTSGGRPSVTPWGKPAKGQPTRRSRQQLGHNAKI